MKHPGSFKIIVACFITLLCIPALAQQSPVSIMKLSASALGPIKIGMSTEEASTAFGQPLVYQETVEGCGWIGRPGLPKGIDLKVVEGVIVMINVSSNTITTLEGAHVGQTEKEIKDLFPGQVKVTPHLYTTGGHYLNVKLKNNKEFGYVFETDGSRVKTIRAGDLNEISLAEGCL